MWDRVQSINAIIKDECETPTEAALRFTISFDAVTTVIPGMRREKNVLANVKNAEKGALSEELIEKLKEHRWQRNFYD